MKRRHHKKQTPEKKEAVTAEINAAPPRSFLRADHVILGEASHGGGGETACLKVLCRRTGLSIDYPQTNKSTESNRRSLRHFKGRGSAEVEVTSDAAQELTEAVSLQGWAPIPAIPRDKPHHGQCERQIGLQEESCRAQHLQAGFDHPLWPLSMTYTSIVLSATQPAFDDASISKWQSALGEPFGGKMIPLGALVYYRTDDTLKFEPRAKPGLMAGWSLGHGLAYREVVLILDLENLRSNKSSRPVQVHERELFVPEQVVFPLAAAKERELRGEVSDLVNITPLPFDSAPTILDKDKKKRGVYITVNTLIEFGPSIGLKCKGCENGTTNHSPACRARFAKLYAEKEAKQVAERQKRAAGIPPAPPDSNASASDSTALVAVYQLNLNNQGGGEDAKGAPTTQENNPNTSIENDYDHNCDIGFLFMMM